jgi:hypothetical protein
MAASRWLSSNICAPIRRRHWRRHPSRVLSTDYNFHKIILDFLKVQVNKAYWPKSDQFCLLR